MKVVVGFLFALSWAALMTGCSNRQQTATVDFSKGCHFTITGMQSEQAMDISKRWSMEDCQIKLDSETGNKKPD